jgi:PKHD-type hydroxylase
MRNNWQLFSGAVSPSDCDRIIKSCMLAPPKEASTFSGDKDSHRRSIVRWVSGDRDIESFILRFVNTANARAFSVDTFQHVEEIQFTEYRAEEKAVYHWHHDIHWESENNSDRKLSFILQLSDPDSYSGGDFEFSEIENPKQHLMRKRGSVLVFPSYLTHRVSQVTSGTRYSLVSWVSGPRWR